MSAPMRVSQNGVMDCLTDTAEVPFAFALTDQDASALASFAAARPFGAGAGRVDASTLSRLQSSLLTSMSFMMSGSLTSEAPGSSSAKTRFALLPGHDEAGKSATPPCAAGESDSPPSVRPGRTYRRAHENWSAGRP